MRQRLNILAKEPDCLVIEEKYTGTSMDRPQWNKLMASARKNRISDIYFDEPSRLGRNSKECFSAYRELYFDCHVHLHFIKCSHIDTKVYEDALNACICSEKVTSGDGAADAMINKILEAVHEYMLSMIEKQIWYAFKEAEDEVVLLSQRTKSGLELARKRGKKIGGIKGVHYRSRSEWKAMPLIIKYYEGFGGEYDMAGVARITGLTLKTTRTYIANIYKEQDIKNEKDKNILKYADDKPYNHIISEIEIYKEAAEEVWMTRYNRPMNWEKITKKKRR